MVKQYITHEEIKRINERTFNGVYDIKIKVPKSFKVLGVCLIGASACPVGLDLITLPLGFSLMTSTNRKQIIPNFTFIFSSNLKKIKKGLNKLYNLRYNKLGIRRF